jgi:Cytochrome P460
MKKLGYALLAAPIVAFIASCASDTMAPAVATKAMKDGELALPANYKSWPVFLSEVQRPDAKQIREIWINPVGAKAQRGGAFPDGTVSVMELYKAKEGPDGALLKDASGKLVKGDLAKVFVMGKFKGSGASAPDGLRNGDWVYSAYLADGKAAPDPIVGCRACHLPLGESKDFVHRYDEYFDKRKS